MPCDTLIALPPAGTGTADFRAWQALLPAGPRVRPVALPGRETLLAIPPLRTMPAVVSWLLAHLHPLPASYALYGHSFGAWVAFELAHEARSRGLPAPAHLVVGARRAPHLPSPRPPIGHLPDPAFVAAVQERYAAIPERLLARPEILAMFLPALRGDFAVLESYRCADRPPLDVPITAIGGLADRTTAPAELDAWADHTTAGFTRRDLAAGHFFLREAPAATCGIVAEALR